VQVDPGFGFQFLVCRDTADVIEMGVRQRDCLKRQTAAFKGFNNPFGLVARIDADGLFGCFAGDDASVLLKRSDG
jgi:hypothetical protein